jgi:hypothetical protein
MSLVVAVGNNLRATGAIEAGRQSKQNKGIETGALRHE